MCSIIELKNSAYKLVGESSRRIFQRIPTLGSERIFLAIPVERFGWIGGLGCD